MLRRETKNEELMEFAPPTSGRGVRELARLDSRFEIHDDNQVELKLDYAFNGDSKWTRYQTEVFFFVPKSLGITKQSYDQKQFFSDTQAYIRFQTPKMPLAAIVDPATGKSPLGRIRALVSSPLEREFGHEQGPLSRELRMFGCVVRANLRDTVIAACARLEELDTRSTGRERRIGNITESVERIADEIDAVCEAFRNLRPDVVGVRCPSWLREHFEHVDEFVSITVESYMTELLAAIQRRNLRDKRKLRELTDDMWKRLARTISREQLHRESLGYATNLSRDDGRNSFVNRASALKKFMTSVLFLKIEPRKSGVSFLQVAAGVAAALAMAFSMGAMFLSERLWGMNSLPFVVAVLIAYVFKDRIKDWVKSFFSIKMARFMPDRSMDVVDPSSEMTVGHCRETFSYLEDSRVPDSVKRWRYAESSSIFFEAEYNPEVVLHYVKDVRILGKRIGEAESRRQGINDIIRWNVSSFLSRMDDPERQVEYLDRDSLELRTAICSKRYDVNVVLVLKESGRPVSVQKFLVVLDRTGIHALEAVALNGSVGGAGTDPVARKTLASA